MAHPVRLDDGRMLSPTIAVFQRAWHDNNRWAAEAFSIERFLDSSGLSDHCDFCFSVAISFPKISFHYRHWGQALESVLGLDLGGCEVSEAELGVFGKEQRRDYLDTVLKGAPAIAKGNFDRNDQQKINFERIVAPIFEDRELKAHALVGLVHYSSFPAGHRELENKAADLNRFSLERMSAEGSVEFISIE